MKKIEGRFRYKLSLTTENIELVLEDRVLKKKIAGADAIRALFDTAPGVIQGLGELVNVRGGNCPAARATASSPFIRSFRIKSISFRRS